MLRKLIATAGLVLLTVSFVSAKQGKGKAKGHQRGQEERVVAVAVFAGPDQRIVHEYVTNYRGGLPPGLAKRDGDLPPGLAKQLRRKGHLPPGLEKRIVPFPVELERQLPPLELGLARGFISGRAVIYNPRTRLIFDVFIPLE